MTGAEYEVARKTLGLSRAALARLMDVDRATAWRWASTGPSESVALALRLMVEERSFLLEMETAMGKGLSYAKLALLDRMRSRGWETTHGEMSAEPEGAPKARPSKRYLHRKADEAVAKFEMNGGKIKRGNP